MPPADRSPGQFQSSLGMTLAALLGQVGCLTALIILVALIAGLWLDGMLQTKPLFTLLLLLGSVPRSILVMVRVRQSGMARVQHMGAGALQDIEEDSDRGD